MTQPLINTLETVRRRQRLCAAIRAAILGVLFGSIAAVILDVVRRTTGWWATPLVSLAVLAAGPIVLTAWTLSRRHPLHRAAATIDQHYQLKDRIVTALAFITQDETSSLQRLAVEDASSHLDRVDLNAVAPMHWSHRDWGAAVALAAAVVLVVWPMSATDANIPAAAIAIVGIVEEAEQLERDFEELKELARQQEEPELEKLATELKDLAEQLKKPGVDVKDALMQLSQMQAMLQQQQAQLNVAMVDAHLAALGKAMSAAAPLAEAGAALEQQDFEKAAKALENLDDKPMDALQRRDAQRKLEQAAKKMQQAGLGELANATSDLANATGSGGGKGIGKAGRRLGRKVRRHSRARRMNQWMMKQLARLSESKSNCLSCGSGMCSSCKGGGCKSCNGSGRNGGNNASLSNKPSLNWGTGSTGNPMGDPTRLDATRDQVNVTGNPGDGPVDTEITRATEARQRTGRDYKDVYREYRKLSDAVLETEPIPLGHRRTIQRYFESIRPADVAETSSDDR